MLLNNTTPTKKFYRKSKKTLILHSIFNQKVNKKYIQKYDRKNVLKAGEGNFQIKFHYLPFFKLYQSTD